MSNTGNEYFWSKPHYNRWYSFEVCIHWEYDICWQVDVLSAYQECRLPSPLFGCSFKNLKGLIAGSFNCFSHCLLPLPRPLPHHFLFQPLFRFCAAVTLTLRTIKEKTAKNRQLHRLTFFAPCLLVVHLFEKPVLTSLTWLCVIKIIMWMN